MNEQSPPPGADFRRVEQRRDLVAQGISPTVG